MPAVAVSTKALGKARVTLLAGVRPWIGDSPIPRRTDS